MPSIIYNGKEIEYLFVRSKRKTISISITPNRGVILRAPLKASESRAIEFLESKIAWVSKHLEKMKERLNSIIDNEIKHGSIQYYLGERYLISVVLSVREYVEIVGNNITIHQTRESHILTDKIFNGWLSNKTLIIFSERYNKIFNDFSYEYRPRVQIKDLKRMWGSFRATGNISLNKKLIHTPIECIDYVIYHELCHYKHMNHGKKFHALLASKMPNYKEVEKRLKNYGKLIGL